VEGGGGTLHVAARLALPHNAPVKISLKPQHLKRYREIAQLLARFGWSEAVRATGLDELLGAQNPLTRHAHPEPRELAESLEAMGPTFVKLGQLLSTRADIVPLRYLGALADLQDKVGPFAYEEVERVVYEELGQRVSKAFLTFEPKPLAAASLGQVHKATLADGREVAVKIQRPNIKARLADDIEVLEEVASAMEAFSEVARHYEVRKLVEDLRRSLMRELDYEEEAENLRTLRENLRDYRNIVVPEPIDDYCTARVLTMEFCKGKKVTLLNEEERKAPGNLAVAQELLQCYIQQICLDGFFHADPHPGNVLRTDDGRIVLLDAGSCGRLTPPMRELLLRLLLAVGEGRSEEAADLVERIGQPRANYDEAKMRRAVHDLVTQQHSGTSVSEANIGAVVLKVAEDAGTCGMRAPRELTLLGRTMLYIDQIGRALAPDFDPYKSIREAAPKLLVQQLGKGMTGAGVFARAMEMNEFVQLLPGRVNRILDRLANSRLEVRIKGVEEQKFVEGLQKVANRVAQGLIIASMIIGAALLMNVKTDFTLFGYPGLAVLLFLAAAGVGAALTIEIWRHDRRKRNDR
jgi:ubiquinone biosynthesis protein